MYKKTITYKDYNDEEVTEDLYFNLSKSEVMKSNFKEHGALENKLRRMVNEKNVQAIGELFADLIGMSYGEKSDDGKHFIKSESIRDRFEHSAAYDALYMALLESVDEAIAFIKGILPSELSKELDNNSEIQALVDRAKA